MRKLCRKFPEALAALLGCALGVLSTAVFVAYEAPTALPVVENKYERAQRQTVLLHSDSGQGSGVVVIRGNRVFCWTAAHVVAGTSKVEAKRFLRTEGHRAGEIIFQARVVYRNEERDFSLLLVNAPANDFLTGAEFDDVLCPPVGTAVIHCGNWLGADFDGSVSEGIISQTGVQPAIENWHWKITDQISATVVPGSSGGPIFRRDNGKCVGIVVGGVGRGALGFASYIPTRVIASEEIIRWAVFGNWCPPDELLEKMIVLAGPVEVINPYE